MKAKFSRRVRFAVRVQPINPLMGPVGSELYRTQNERYLRDMAAQRYYAALAEWRALSVEMAQAEARRIGGVK